MHKTKKLKTIQIEPLQNLILRPDKNGEYHLAEDVANRLINSGLAKKYRKPHKLKDHKSKQGVTA